MCSTCSGGNTPRSATSKPYNPQTAPKPNYNHRQGTTISGNGSKSNAFGKPRVTFSGRK